MKREFQRSYNRALEDAMRINFPVFEHLEYDGESDEDEELDLDDCEDDKAA